MKARERKTNLLRVCVTHGERAQIGRGAEIAGVTISRWMRDMALEAAEILVRESAAMMTEAEAKRRMVQSNAVLKDKGKEEPTTTMTTTAKEPV